MDGDRGTMRVSIKTGDSASPDGHAACGGEAPEHSSGRDCVLIGEMHPVGTVQPDGHQPLSSASPPPAVQVPPGVIKWCRRLGMQDGAIQSWGLIQEVPYVAFAGYAVGQTVACMGRVVLYIIGLPPSTKLWLRVVVNTFTILPCINLLLFLHRGTSHAHTRLWLGIFTVYMLLLLPACAVIFSGPEENFPFQNRAITTVLTVVCIFGDELAAKCGGVRFDHPKEPHKNLLKPLAQAALVTMRTMDSLTDLTVVAIVLEKARNGCWWFGEPGRCLILQQLAAGVAVCAIADLCCGLFLATVSEVKNQSQRAYKLVLALHVGCFLCELGVVACTLVNFFAGDDPSHVHIQSRSSELGVTIVSLCTTFASFGVTLVGASNALKLARAFMVHLSTGGNKKLKQAMSASRSLFKSTIIAPEPEEEASDDYPEL